jgi:hypothetical protein
MVRISGLVIVVTLALGACGDPEAEPGAASPPPPASPDRLEIVCREDGSTELVTDRVRAQADGVHVQVDNRAGEFVSINGVGLDFKKGVSEQTARAAPGELKVACWPGSMHEEPEPERQPVEIVDPDGHWVAAELECPRDKLAASAILDYASDSIGIQGDPEDITRSKMEGLEDGDEITTVGYPESAPREIAIERSGETIALVSYSRAHKGGWFLDGYDTCDSSGISY